MQLRETQIKIGTGATALNDILGGGIESRVADSPSLSTQISTQIFSSVISSTELSFAFHSQNFPSCFRLHIISEIVSALTSSTRLKQSITEICGEFRCGKTQLCHTMCVITQLPTEHTGANGKVLYIDTEGTFRPERIKDICERFNVEFEAVLDNISWARAYNHEMQMDFLNQAAGLMCQDQVPFKLIIVDSATALYRADFCGRGELAERQQKLGAFLSTLHKLAEEFNLAVLITNQVVADVGSSAMFVANAQKAIGGHIMAHACTTRLSLRKGRGEQRICKIYDSPSMPEADATYQLTKGGIADLSE